NQVENCRRKSRRGVSLHDERSCCWSCFIAKSIHKQKLVRVKQHDAELREAVLGDKVHGEGGLVVGWFAGERQNVRAADLGGAVGGGFAFQSGGEAGGVVPNK